MQITPDVEKSWYETLYLKQLFHNEQIAYEKIFPEMGWTDSAIK